MAIRATKARLIAAKNPASVEMDERMLPWVWSEDDGCWLSFNGNYSNQSTTERKHRARAREQRESDWQVEAENRARERYELNAYWSMVRADVLARDNGACQLCGSVGGMLHIHHILKRNKGGTDHLDNLITVCPKCHKLADGKGYNPEWKTPAAG